MRAINGLSSSRSAWASAGTQRSDRPPAGADPSQFKQALFNNRDADGSGGVDSGELGKLLNEVAQRSGQAVGRGSATPFSQMDSNADGTVSATEQAAGEVKQALKDLLKAVDRDGDPQISRREAHRFAEVLQPVAGASSASRVDSTGSSSSNAHSSVDSRATDFRALAHQVLRHDAQAAANSGDAATGSSLSVAA